MMGVWINNGIETTCFNVLMSADGKIDAVRRGTSGSSVYTVKRVYHTHGTNRSLKKLTVAKKLLFHFSKFSLGPCLEVCYKPFMATIGQPKSCQNWQL